MAGSGADVIVVGLGAMGGAAALALARRGARVIGLDRFAPPHGHGSSHGETRIIREAYFEHPLYVPLVRRALELWLALEEEWGAPLYRRTGGLMIGHPEGGLLPGSRASAEAHAVPHELLSGEEIRRRWATLHPEPGMVGLLEHRAGLLFVEEIVQAQLELARRSGADLRYGTEVRRWSAGPAGVRVETADGEISADSLVLAAGAWMGRLVPVLGPHLQVERQTIHWYAPAAPGARFHPDRWPLVLWDPGDEALFATFPDVGGGVKAIIHHSGILTDVAVPEEPPTADEETRMRSLLARFAPEAGGPRLRAVTCLYTNTPDRHFLIDRHPEASRVLLLSPCSGHGFKFSSVIGEIAAGLVLQNQPRFDLTPFRLARFNGQDPL